MRRDLVGSPHVTDANDLRSNERDLRQFHAEGSALTSAAILGVRGSVRSSDVRFATCEGKPRKDAEKEERSAFHRVSGTVPSGVV